MQAARTHSSRWGVRRPAYHAISVLVSAQREVQGQPRPSRRGHAV